MVILLLFSFFARIGKSLSIRIKLDGNIKIEKQMEIEVKVFLSLRVSKDTKAMDVIDNIKIDLDSIENINLVYWEIDDYKIIEGE